MIIAVDKSSAYTKTFELVSFKQLRGLEDSPFKLIVDKL